MLTIVLLAACAEFTTPDEACPDSIPGDGAKTTSPAEAELFGRFACYRRIAGVDRPKIMKLVGVAVDAHANYLDINDIDLSDPFAEWQEERFGEFGFTGTTAYERLVDSGYILPTSASPFVWEVLYPVDESLSYTDQVDALIDDPFLRDVFLAPTWDGASYAEFEATVGPYTATFAYTNVVLFYPSGANALRPVVYPADGQVDVETTFTNSFALTGNSSLAAVPEIAGYPITFTFGSTRVTSGTNPLGVQVVASTIMDPSGNLVEHIVALPGDYTFGKNWSTAILIPTTPLAPNTTYTVSAQLSWIERENYTMTTTFTTGPG